jgi:hypothetical protein
LIAAFVSLSKDSPQLGQKCQRTLSGFLALFPQPEQSWDVYAGFTAMIIRPALSALLVNIDLNRLQLASAIDFAK